MVFKIPRVVRVGPFEYVVSQEQGLRDEDDDESFGLVNHSDLIIRLDNSCKRPAQETFIHEVIHVIDRNAGESLDERQVAMLGTGLFQLLKDNPKLLDFNKE